MTPAGYRYYRQQLDDLLLNAWDPIGVSGEEAAKDEYLSYSAKISAMIESGELQEEICEYLRWVECTHMGLTMTNALLTKQVSRHALSIFQTARLMR